MKARKDPPPEGNRPRRPSKRRLAEDLHNAIMENNLIMVQGLLDKGADPDAGVDPEVTQLFHAVECGDSEAVWLLLEAGADTDRICNSGSFVGTALDLAKSHGDDYKSITALLHEHDAVGMEDLARETRAKIKTPTIAGLRERFDNSDQTILYRLAERGDFAQALDIVRADRKDRLTADDLTRTYNSGSTVVDMLGRRGKLDLVFAADLWYGRGDELKKLWQAVPDKYKKQVDYQQVLHTVNRDELKRAMKTQRRLKR